MAATAALAEVSRAPGRARQRAQTHAQPQWLNEQPLWLQLPPWQRPAVRRSLHGSMHEGMRSRNG